MKYIASSLLLACCSFSAFSATPIDIKTVPEIMQAFEKPEIYRKRTVTLGRLPQSVEIGQQFPTYVSDGKGGYKLETTNRVTDSVIVARMPFAVAGNIYNEWLIPKDKWQETYGELPTSTKFERFKRIKTIQAIKIDERILKLLNSQDGKTATIAVSWDPKGMQVFKNGYLAEREYGIAPEEMQQNYERIK
ncbi:MAG: hypothetical protein ACRC8G_14675 [Plesiomonas shigelloides]